MRIRGRNKKKLHATIDRGRKLVAAQQEQEAFEFLEEAVRQFPDDAEIRLLYASILLVFRLNDVAVEAAKAAELSPNDPVILVRASSLMLNRGEVEAARSYAVRAKELVQPDFVLMSGLMNLNGLLAAHDGEDALAEEELRSAVEKDPSFSSFAVDLVKFLVSRGRQTDAVAVIDEALAHVRDMDELKRLRGEIEAKL